MTLIVDRIEENLLVVELPEGNFVNIPREIAPTAKEGDVLKVTLDMETKEKRLKSVNQLVNDLFED